MPAFGPWQIMMPANVTINTSFTTISTAQSLVVDWSRGQTGAQVLFVAAAVVGTTSVEFTCLWDAAAGTGTVPQSLLSPAAGGHMGTLAWTQRVWASETAGAYSVQLGAGAETLESTTFQ